MRASAPGFSPAVKARAGGRLRLTHRMSMADVAAAANGVAAGDDIITILSRNGAGWHRLLDKLTAALDGTAPDLGDPQSLRDRYAAQLS
jgi:hypothetical protein